MSVAVIRLGNSQYVVSPGKIMRVKNIAAETGQTLELTDLLGKKLVRLTVGALSRGAKVRGLKFKNKTRYLKHFGQRASIAEIKVESID